MAQCSKNVSNCIGNVQLLLNGNRNAQRLNNCMTNKYLLQCSNALKFVLKVIEMELPARTGEWQSNQQLIECHRIQQV